MTPGDILAEARALLTGDRQAQYGDPLDTYTRAAALASILTGADLDAGDVVKVMIAVKLARQAGNPKRDNLVDAAAYLDILGVC